MARRGRQLRNLVLTEAEQAELERLARRCRVNRSVAFRAKLILLCSLGTSNKDVAKKLQTTRQTVGRVRERFLEQRMDGLYDEPRVGAPRKVSDEAVEEIITKTLESKPRGRTHWSTRSMAKSAGASKSTVSRIWRAFGLQPHRTRSFKMSDDPQFTEKVRDIVGLYLSPPANAIVFSVDEKSQIQALQRSQPVLPMDFGEPERHTHNYVRHGTLDLFAALEVASGKVIARCKKQHRAKDFVAFLKVIDASVDPALDVHLVLDNLATHKARLVQRWLHKHPRFKLHFTPTYASWMNLVESFFGLLTQHALVRGSHTSVPQLRAAIMEYVDGHNDDCKPFVWTKTADEILDSVKRFCTRTLEVHAPENM